MRMYRKTIQIIEMTEHEIATFQRLMKQAAEGQTVHYAEQQMDDGKHLGVSVIPPPVHYGDDLRNVKRKYAG